MCGDCYHRGFFVFPTYWKFDTFAEELQQKVTYGPLQAVACAANFPDSIGKPEAFYRCPSCRETWALSSPDNAWRGYFLPMHMAKTYLRDTQRKAFIRGIIRKILLLAIAAYLFWKWLH